MLVKNLREAAGLSQRELARLAGISRTSIFDYEQGRNIPEDRMDKIAAALAGFIDLAYVGGLFDRSSTITITRTNKGNFFKGQKSDHYVARVDFSSKHKLLCEMLVQIFGVGRICSSKSSLGHVYYHYYVACKNVEVVLGKLVPYLRLKKRQAEVVLEFRKALMEYKHDKKSYAGKGRQPLPQSQLDLYHRLWQEVRSSLP